MVAAVAWGCALRGLVKTTPARTQPRRQCDHDQTRRALTYGGRRSVRGIVGIACGAVVARRARRSTLGRRRRRRVYVIVVARHSAAAAAAACVRATDRVCVFFHSTQPWDAAATGFLFSRCTNGKHYFVDRNPVRMRRGNNAPRPAVVH